MIRKETLKVLEFDRFLDAVSKHASSSASEEAVRAFEPLTDKSEILTRFAQVGELRRMADTADSLKMRRFEDVSLYIEKVRPEDAGLEPKELVAFAPFFDVAGAVLQQLGKTEYATALRALTSDMRGFSDLLKDIRKTVGDDGDIKDTASTLLFDLRARIRSLEKRVTKRLEEIVREKNITPFIQEDVVTTRSGRWVVLVRMDSKGLVPGVVHDVSRSGETAFVEPIEIIGLANELENLKADAKTEEIRIIRDICKRLRADIDRIEYEFSVIVYLDSINAVSIFSGLYSFQIPEISDDFELLLSSARHPILGLLGKQVVPLDIRLDAENRVMVITGPNAGGKTISIKTVGLLLLMALSGLPVPANSSSVFPMVSSLLVDIGDEQSLEHSLSTFSAHISNITRILSGADDRTIVLLDELGTGTDPSQGSAIACAVLDSLREKGSMVLATTHLIDIVGFVHKTGGMINASMDFDMNTHMPLYKLRVGEPGQSYALEIATNYGLPPAVAEHARRLYGTMKEEFHELLRDLKAKSIGYDNALNEMQAKLRTLTLKENEMKEKVASFEREKSNAIKKANEEARDIIVRAKREVYDLIDEAKKDKKKAHETLRNLSDLQKNLDRSIEEGSGITRLNADDIKIGDVVYVVTLGYDGKVVTIDANHGRARVNAGGLDIDVSTADLAVAKGVKEPVKKPAKIDDTAEAVPYEIMLIGMRVEEAIDALEPYLNHASLAGMREVRIIHGMGTGRLMKGIREYLNTHPLVRNYRGGDRSEGGAGATVATLK